MSKAYLGDELLYDSALLAPRTSLWLPGTTGNYASCPDSVSTSITGDFDIRWFGSLDDWTPAGTTTLVAKDSGSTQRSFMVVVLTSGVLRLYVSMNGSSVSSVDSTVAPTVTNGALLWIRVTRASATGATTFYTSINGTTWTQLGSTVSTTSGSPYDSTQPLSIGSYDGSSWLLKGRTLKAEVRNGINGTVVASPDFTAPKSSRFLDAQDNLWTINGSAWAWEKA